jgi:hypothetical protein
MAKNSEPEAASPRQSRYLLWIVGVGLGLVFAAPVLLTLFAGRTLGETFPSQGNSHINLGDPFPSYNSDPPTSGWHVAELTAWGSYDEVVLDQQLVHNLEDGGVILWYEYGTPASNANNIQFLETIASTYDKVIIAPREVMPTPYALTAWTRLQRFNIVDHESMKAFLEAYYGRDHHVAGEE